MSEKPPKDPYEGLDIEGALKKAGIKGKEEKPDERTIEEIIQNLPAMTAEKIDEVARKTEEKIKDNLRKEGLSEEEVEVRAAEVIKKVREQAELAKNQLGGSTSK